MEFRLSPEIKLPNGRIRGKLHAIPEKGDVASFLGIPYGKPPIGDLRFRKPEPAEAWEHVRDCTKFGPSCPQKLTDTLQTELETSEDCLYVNVFAPRWKPPAEFKKFPVIFYVHGGAWQFGSSTKMGDENIARRDCGYLYRFGMFGCLATEDGEVKGNQGQWDQALALKWTRDNIEAFGGDPEHITLMGQSAGAAIVDLLLLSPHTRDLFHRAVIMAGSSHYNIPILPLKVEIELCNIVLRNLGYDGSMPVLSWLSQKSTDSLTIPRSSKIHKRPPGFFRLFQPVMDGDFIPKPLKELRKETPIKSILTGTTKWEGLSYIFAYGFETIDLKRKVEELIREERFGEKCAEVQKRILDFYATNTDDEVEQTKAAIKVGICATFLVA